MEKNFIQLLVCVLISNALLAQIRTPAQQLLITNEDSLNAGVSTSKTIISGYGSAFYQRNFNDQKATMNLERIVLFIGHQFNSKISFFSEMELENAKVGAESNGEISMEQAYLKFNLTPRQYITAGLFIPRIGLINENHLPVNFNGVEKPFIEQLVIPATWRELGIGFYGRLKKLPLNYSIALVNGLNSAGFVHGTGLRDGRFEGSKASANSLAITAALQYYYKDFSFQVSGYAGGSNSLNKRASDSLGISSGFFGMPVYLTEGNIQWANNGFSVKALAAYVTFPDATDVNKVYASNISKSMYGAYAEVAYDVFEHIRFKEQQFKVFGRFETFDLNASIPSNALYDGTQKQNHLIAGITYMPIRNVVIKTDIRLLHTGEENPSLVINPSPVRLPYRTNNQFLNIGIGYSF